MEAFKKLTSTILPFDRSDIDTDQIIPKQFLKRITKSGYGEFLFYNWRYDSKGNPNLSFELNDLKYKGSQILLTGNNFGSGSSREHAAWALLDYGFKCIIAPSFADIFYNNCFENGILPISLPNEIINPLMLKCINKPTFKITINLLDQTITNISSSKSLINFEIDYARKNTLLKGIDNIGETLRYENKIKAFEAKQGKYKGILPF